MTKQRSALVWVAVAWMVAGCSSSTKREPPADSGGSAGVADDGGSGGAASGGLAGSVVSDGGTGGDIEPDGGTGAIEPDGGTGGNIEPDGGTGGIEPIGGMGGIAPIGGMGGAGQAGAGGTVSLDCGLDFSPLPDCEACLDVSCCAEQETCLTDSYCVDLIGCLNSCEGYDEPCLSECYVYAWGDALAELEAINDCALDQCPECVPLEVYVNVEVTGLASPIALTLNGQADSSVVLQEDGSYLFPTTVLEGRPYWVDVTANPSARCVLVNSVGIVPGHDVLVTMECRPDLTVPVPSVQSPFWARMLAVQSADGSITSSYDGSAGFGLFRIDGNGLLDPGFGDGSGYLEQNPDYYAAARLDFLGMVADGSMRAVGHYYDSVSGYAMIGVYSLLPSGQLPAEGGLATLDWYGGIGSTEPTAGALHPDGSLVVAADVWNGAATQAGIVRFDPTGALDPSFGLEGKALLADVADEVRAPTLHVSAMAYCDPWLMVAGSDLSTYCDGMSEQCDVLVRLDASGAPDPTFDTTWVADVFHTVSRILVLADGDVLLSGFSEEFAEPIVARLSGSDGTLVATSPAAPWPFLQNAAWSGVPLAPVLWEDADARSLAVAGMTFTDNGAPVLYVSRLSSELTFDSAFNEVGAMSIQYTLTSWSGTAVSEQAAMGLFRGPQGGMWLLSSVLNDTGYAEPALHEFFAGESVEPL